LLLHKPFARNLPTSQGKIFNKLHESSLIYFSDNLLFLKIFFHSCEEYVYNGTSTGGCKWDYTGQGFDYQILAGPIFILIYTFAAIPVGIAADLYNRKVHSDHILAADDVVQLHF